ncbi:MAG: OmpA family protein [Eubacteriales bacterium]|nr:OmpA family protein [Eubacteriales bacterium]
MRNSRRGRDVFKEPSYWQSYSDMMAALLLIFILIIAVTLGIYQRKTADLEDAQAQLNATRLELEEAEKERQDSLVKLQDAYAKAVMTEDELKAAYAAIDEAQTELDAARSELQDIVGIRTDIIGELQSKFSNSTMQVDPQTGSITFSSDVLFRYNSATLTGDSRATLKSVIPMYLDVLLQDSFRPYIAEIIIEGHTDTDGDYQSNMTLSYNRANSVARFCLNSANGLTGEQIALLEQLLTVNGRSYSDPIYKENTDQVDMAASRRVEIKFRLKEDEMIEKITEVLNQS